MKRIPILVAIVFFVGVCLFVLKANGQEDDFFSEKRLFLSSGLINKIPREGNTQKEIHKFAEKYEDGLYALSGGEMERAEKDLLTARKAWPEYYGTDFALALLYERTDRIDLAARYYKSYLNKLTDLHRGQYRISGPLMVSMAQYGVEDPSLAREFIRQRLYSFGVDIDKVRPVISLPEFLFPVGSGLLVGILFIVLHYWILPALKIKYRVKNPPEGFWVCPGCGAETPVLANECQECGRPRKKEK